MKKTKFSDYKTLEDAKSSFICTTKDEEIPYILKHQYPETQSVMKDWAEFVLHEAKLPIPKSSWNTWYVLDDNGDLIQLEKKSDHFTKWNRRGGTLASFLKENGERWLEYKAAKLLEEIELLEESIDKDSAKGAAHHAMNAAAMYYEAFIGMNFSTPTIIGHKQKIGTKKPRKKRMPELDNWINEQDLSKSTQELWRELESQGNDYDSRLYIDGEKLIEVNDEGKETDIKYTTFSKRISLIRKNNFS